MDVHDVNFGNFKNYTITVHKFVDINGDGIENGGDDGVAGIQITVSGAATASGVTDANGNMTIANVGPGEVHISENLSQSAFTWINVSTSLDGIRGPAGDISFAGLSAVDRSAAFGNMVCNIGVAKTLGFWANNADKTLQQIMVLNNDLDIAGITNTLYATAGYVNSSGVNDFTSFKSFRSWILSANASDMRYMLSAQLAAAGLNLGSGGASAYSLVTMTDAQVSALGLSVNAYTRVLDQRGVMRNVIQVRDVMMLANQSLANCSLTRCYMEALKTILDDFNNMRNLFDSPLC